MATLRSLSKGTSCKGNVELQVESVQQCSIQDFANYPLADLLLPAQHKLVSRAKSACREDAKHGQLHRWPIFSLNCKPVLPLPCACTKMAKCIVQQLLQIPDAKASAASSESQLLSTDLGKIL